MSLSEKQARLAAELGAMRQAQDRLAWIVRRGRQTGSLDAASKRDEFLVPGCLSKLWMIPSFENSRCFFRCDSDSAIVKGVAVLVCELYNDCSPEEILSHEPSCLATTGIPSLLTPNRRNGLANLIQSIQAFASKHFCDSSVVQKQGP